MTNVLGSPRPDREAGRRRRVLVAAAAGLGLVGAGLWASTAANAAAGCSVSYAVSSQWGGGFIADVTVKNLGDPWSAWTVGWTFGAGQSVTSAWNATVTQSGSAVSAANAGWNGGVATDGSTSFGLQGSWSGSNPVPTGFSVNGTACNTTGGGSTTTTTTSAATTTTTRPTTSTTTTTTTSTTSTTRPTTTTSTTTSTTSRTSTTTTTSRATSTTTTSGGGGKTLYVATSGSDSAAGTVAAPLATIQKAIDLSAAGTTIAVRGGTYAPTTNLQITKSGTSSAPITLTNYNGEKVLLDAEGMSYTPGALGSTIPSGQRGAIHMTANYWKIVGLEIAHGPYGVYCDDCNNNTFERLVTRDNYESGFQLQGDSANNLILNLDSYGNRDPRKNGESADGIGIKEGGGSGNVVRGARLWNNVDDGLDLWLFTSPVTIETTISYGNGVNRWGFSDFAGDGNGFKLGGGDPDPAANHVVKNSIAYQNAAHGFTDNGNPGALTVDHNTAWKNTKTGFAFGNSKSKLTANLAVNNATTVSLGSGSASGNSWQIGGTWNDAALQSTSSSTITGTRGSNGAIPTSSFLRPANGANVGAAI